MGSASSEVFGPVPRWRVVRGLTIFTILLVIELLLVGGWAAYQALAARDELLEARAETRVARAALGELDLPGARAHFENAAEGFGSGHERLAGPILRALTVLPVVGDDLRAARTLAWGGSRVAEAALAVVTAADDLGGLDAFAPVDGGLPVQAIDTLAEPAARASLLLDDVANAVAALPGEGLLPQIADARLEFVGELDEARALVSLAEEVTGTLPAFLGAEEPRSYLFAAQNPAEQRGTGGFMGAYAVLEVDDGRLDFGEFIRIQELRSLHVSQIDAPNADYAARYDRFGGAGFWQGINATPDFPTAARAIENLWEATEDGEVDGVIAVDPLAFEALLAVSGPVEVPGFGLVGEEDVVEVVANEAYTAFETEERKQILGAIAAGALQGALSGGEIGPLEGARALLDIAERGHLKVYASAPEEQRLLERFGVTGAMLDPAGDYLSVSVNSGSFTKLDFYMDRAVAYDVTLNDDGSANGVTRVTFTNSAPTEGLPSNIIGPGYGGRLEVGENRSYVSIFCAVGCVPAPQGGARLEEELGHPVVSRFITVRSGEAVTVEAQWHVPDVWDPDSGEYVLTYQAQPTLRPTKLEVNVEPPSGVVLQDGGTWSGRVEGDERIVISAERT